MAMSGLNERTLTRRSAALPDRPTTSCPASSSKRRCLRATARCRQRQRCAGSFRAHEPRSSAGASTSRGVHKCLWIPVLSAPARRRRQHAASRASVARILAETDRPVEAYAAVLEVVGSSLGWELGAVWEAGPGDDLLRCIRTGTPAKEPLSSGAERADHPRTRRGLPGRVVRVRRAGVDRRRSRGRQLSSGRHRPAFRAARGVRFSAAQPRGVVGMMEFFTRDLRQPDERLLETMRDLGSQVGQYVARRHAEEAVRASESSCGPCSKRRSTPW